METLLTLTVCDFPILDSPWKILRYTCPIIIIVAIIRTLLIFHPPCQDGVEIRGCCFSHTVLIEQYTSDLIGKLLAKHGVLVGNLPLAMWQYDSIQEDALPEVIKYCGVFETLGEKRLASHLFPGLESLLPLVFQDITMEQVNTSVVFLRYHCVNIVLYL